MLVLPNLVSLDIGLIPQLIPYIPNLLSATVAAFHTVLYDYEEDETSERLSLTLIDSLPTFAPRLRVLGLSSSSFLKPFSLSKSMLRACKSLSASLTKFTSQDCVVMMHDVLDLLSNADSLTFLSVNLSNSSIPIPHDRVCADIRVLDLRVDAIRVAAELMEALSTKRLNSFKVVTRSNPINTIQRLGLALEASCSVTELNEVFITWFTDRPSQPTDRQYAVSDTSLEPFLAFHRMSSFSIVHFRRLSFDLSVQFVRRLATSWPCISYLSLASNKPCGTWVSKVKLVPDLVDLISGCSQLQHLGLDVDFTCDDNMLLFCPPQSVKRSIFLPVGYAIVSKPKLLAAILSAFLPGVTIAQSWNARKVEEAKNYNAWIEVHECLDMMNAVRSQERTWLPVPASLS